MNRVAWPLARLLLLLFLPALLGFPGMTGVSNQAQFTCSGCYLWLKANAISGLSDGNSIGASSLPDSSGNGYGSWTVGTTPAVFKEKIVNGYPSVRYNGSADYTVNAAGTQAVFKNRANVFVLAVFKLASSSQTAGATPIFFNTSMGSANTMFAYYINQDAANKWSCSGRRANGDSRTGVTGNTVTTNLTILGCEIDYVNTTMNAYENGAFVGTNASFQTTGNSENLNAGVAFSVGGGPALAGILNGDVFEVIVGPMSIRSAATAAMCRKYAVTCTY